jgi:hypothetical protein
LQPVGAHRRRGIAGRSSAAGLGTRAARFIVIEESGEMAGKAAVQPVRRRLGLFCEKHRPDRGAPRDWGALTECALSIKGR